MRIMNLVVFFTVKFVRGPDALAVIFRPSGDSGRPISQAMYVSLGRSAKTVLWQCGGPATRDPIPDYHTRGTETVWISETGR